jgi:hypothetical protein
MKIRRIIEENFLVDDAVTGALVPFKFREVQNKYYNILENDYEEANNFSGAREIILKARKEGFTSLILGIFAAVCVISKDPIRYLEISYKDDATLQHFRRFRTYVLSFYAKQAGLPQEVVTDDKFMRTIFSSYREGTEMVLRDNGASFYVGTANAKTGERGGTVQGILFTEDAHFPDTDIITADEIVEGTQSMVAVGTGMIFRESTANSFNHFYKAWDQAIRKEIIHRPRFFSWRDFYTPEQFEIIKAGFSDKRKIMQEFPDNPEEAFIASGATYIENIDLHYYLEQIKLWEANHGLVSV